MKRREKAFVQRFEMVSPEGGVIKQTETPFKFSEGKHNHKIRPTVNGLPIGEAGIWSINLHVKDNSPDAQWSLGGSLPLHVEIKRKQSDESKTETTEAE